MYRWGGAVMGVEQTHRPDPEAMRWVAAAELFFRFVVLPAMAGVVIWAIAGVVIWAIVAAMGALL